MRKFLKLILVFFWRELLIIRISKILDFRVWRLTKSSSSQLLQDIFVLKTLKFKRNGFFVEFGATDGVYLSNSLLLEKSFDWNGILAEPGRIWHHDLHKNRRAIIDRRCLWKESKCQLQFNETASPELSTLEDFQTIDFHDRNIGEHITYEVETVTLKDLLKDNMAPFEIDYLSIDTEGSEFEILSHFDFTSHKIKIITCEHNYGPNRTKIDDLLTSHGYRRVLQRLTRFEDWYVLRDSI